MNRLFKFAATFLALLLLLLPLSSVRAEREILSDPGAKVTIERIAGHDRYETAILLSQATFSKADTAVIASGETWPDALMGGQLAYYSNGPLLLVSHNEVRDDVLAELNRLGVTKLLLLGGDATLSAELEQSLRKQYEIVRLEGTDRYATSEHIGEYIRLHFKNKNRPDYPAFPSYYVDGNNFPDALSATPFVFNYGRNPGILYFYDPKTSEEPGVFIGGSMPTDGKMNISGKDRYETASMLFGHSEMYATTTIVLVDGTNFADGLTAGAVAWHWKGNILLTTPNSLPESVKELMHFHNYVDRVVIVGGTQSVSDDVVEEIRNIR